MITIPLNGGAASAHQTFSMQLGDNYLDFRLNYITRTGQWCLDISLDGVALIAGGMLEPSAELTAFTDADIGRLLFYGEQPTLDNLGLTNWLVWVDG